MESPKPRRHVRQIERGGRIARTRRGLVTCQYRAMGSVLARRSSFCWERRSSPPSARRCDAHSNSCRFLPFGQRPASDLSRQSGSGAAGALASGKVSDDEIGKARGRRSPAHSGGNGTAGPISSSAVTAISRTLSETCGAQQAPGGRPPGSPITSPQRSRRQWLFGRDFSATSYATRERSSRRRSPRTLVLPLGHSTRFAVDRFLQESRTAPTLHRIDLKSAKRRDDRDRIVGIGKYFVTYGGEVIGEFSCAECDVARWLLARGLAGEGDTLVAFWNDGQPGLTGNVGWLAGKGTVSGKTRLRRLPGTMGHQKPRLPSSRRGGQSRRRGSGTARPAPSGWIGTRRRAAAVLVPMRSIVGDGAAALSEQFFGPPLAVVASGHEQPVPIFQQLA